MCAMKYVFLFTYEIEKESELECVTAYLSIFQGCYIEKTTNKIPFLFNLHPREEMVIQGTRYSAY